MTLVLEPSSSHMFYSIPGPAPLLAMYDQDFGGANTYANGTRANPPISLPTQPTNSVASDPPLTRPDPTGMQQSMQPLSQPLIKREMSSDVVPPSALHRVFTSDSMTNVQNVQTLPQSYSGYMNPLQNALNGRDSEMNGNPGYVQVYPPPSTSDPSAALHSGSSSAFTTPRSALSAGFDSSHPGFETSGAHSAHVPSYPSMDQQMFDMPSSVPPMASEFGFRTSTSVQVAIGSSLDRMGKEVSIAANDLKTGNVKSTIPVLKELVQKISDEVEAAEKLPAAVEALSLSSNPNPLSESSPSALELPNSASSRKRSASPLNLDLDRQPKALKSTKTEPVDNLLASGGTPLITSPPNVVPYSQMVNSQVVNSMPPYNGIGDQAGGYSMTDPMVSPTSSTWAQNPPPSRHQHSQSSGSVTAVPISKSVMPPPPNGPGGMMPLGRMNRSGSLNGTLPPHPFTRVEPNQNPYPPQLGQPSHVIPHWPPPSVVGSSPSTSSQPDMHVKDTYYDVDASGDDDDDDTGYPNTSRDSPLLGLAAVNDIPAEYQGEVDRIFFDFLNDICSNLDATDSKGEPIHQTLMAKKMKRMDESGDFRPFKFRIQAFTSTFLEKLAENGYPDEKIPMKKIRNYLWRHKFILRFNEDGKKAKSKGNHIWNIHARKLGEGKWEFRPFERRLAGFPSGIAYRGLPWSYTARIWDPQSSWNGVPVSYSALNLPPWLSWKDNVLSGVPGNDAVSCEFIVIAHYNYQGQEGIIKEKFQLDVAPQSHDSFPRSRRPSLIGERRSVTDTALQPRSRRNSVTAPMAPTDDVLQVLQNVRERSSNELESSHSVGAQQDYQKLVKQQHVLEKTVSALVDTRPQSESQALCDAAGQVVLSAAKTAYTKLSSSRAPSINEVSTLTKMAITEAVSLKGTCSSEVDIILTAESILKTEQSPPHPFKSNSTPPLAGPMPC